MNVAPQDGLRHRNTTYNFGCFVFDARTRLLFREGKGVHLTPKVLDVLLVLVEARGQLVEKDHLMKAVWPDRFVEDGNLTQSVSILRKTLGENPDGGQYIETIPTRGYRLAATVNEVTQGNALPPESSQGAPQIPVSSSEPGVPPMLRWNKRAGYIAAVSLIALAVAALQANRMSYSRKASEFTSTAMHIRPLTTYPGGQYEPAFSPDGSQIAFVWNGNKQDNFDIYVKFVDGGDPLRITTNPAGDGSPAWSPDGHKIAFLRYATRPGESGFYIVSALGGPESKIGDAAPLAHIFDRHLDWSPDGLLLAVADKIDPDGPFGIFVISIKTGERRRITAPPSSTIGDTGPAFSPDGRTVAFRRTVTAGVNDIYVVSAAGGEPERLTFDGAFTAGHAWTPDGRELVFSSSLKGMDGLWRVSASGGNVRRIHSVGQGAYYVSVSRRGHHLAYSRWFADTNIWRLAIGNGAAKPEELISSTWEERSAQYSPDGTRIAFRSDRSGNNEIWVCDASGSNPLQLTSFGGPLTGTPRWSPDGKNLAFDSRPEGDSVVYTISALGGMPHRITPNGSNGAVPSWSHDGKWIYFASRRGDGFQVWKVPVNGQLSDGDPLQVTRHGGFAAFESMDGQLVYYSKGHDVPGLWVVPANGGGEKPVISDFNVGFWGYWAVVARGIYFLAPLPPTRAGVNFYSFDSRSSKLIAILPNEPPFDDSGFAVSPDESRVLYTHVDNSGSDIMLVEDFR